MSVCVYLKKDINWRDVEISPSVIDRNKELTKSLGIGIGEFRSSVKNVCMNRWGIPIVKNDDTNPTNRIFYTEESFTKCLNYDWIIPMDDDDDLGKLPSLLFQSTEKDVICWKAYEYSFIDGLEREDFFLKDEDCPLLEKERNNKPLLPGCYAISKRTAIEALDSGSVGSVVNFFSAMNYFQSTEKDINFTGGVYTTRPYTHLSEYYLYGECVTDPVFTYSKKHEFLDIIKGIYLLGKSRI